MLLVSRQEVQSRWRSSQGRFRCYSEWGTRKGLRVEKSATGVGLRWPRWVTGQPGWARALRLASRGRYPGPRACLRTPRPDEGRHLLNCRAVSVSGLQCGSSSSRRTTHRVRKHGTGMGWAQVRHVRSIQSGTTRNISSPLHTFRPPREASSGPKNLACAVHALLPPPIAHAAFTHGRGNPATHLEPSHRLADHREQPGRQRDQLGRELSVRPTWGDGRKRHPVPHEQHRQEHIRPVQTRRHSGMRALRCPQRKALPSCALSHGRVPLQYAMSE